MELLNLQIQKVELELQCATTSAEQLAKKKELLELRTEKAQLELQQATNKLKTKVSGGAGVVCNTVSRSEEGEKYVWRFAEQNKRGLLNSSLNRHQGDYV